MESAKASSVAVLAIATAFTIIAFAIAGIVVPARNGTIQTTLALLAVFPSGTVTVITFTVAPASFICH